MTRTSTLEATQDFINLGIYYTMGLSPLMPGG